MELGDAETARSGRDLTPLLKGVDGGSDLGVDEEVQGTVTTATVRAWSRSDWHSPLSTLWSIKRVMYLSCTDYFNTIHTVSE